MEKKRINNKVTESFKDFIDSAETGGSGYRYEFGSNPDESSEPSAEMNIKEVLGFISDISNTALNVIDSKGVSDAELEKMVRIKKLVNDSRKSLTEAYLRLQDLNRD